MMRWWLRVVLTLVLAPLLWRLGLGYLASQQGAVWGDLARQSPQVLASVYITFTLPALGLCAVLAVMDLALHKLGLDLFTVILSPLVASLVATAIVRFVANPHVQAVGEAATVVALAYGLVWGLTIREPPGFQPVRRHAAAPETDISPSEALPRT